MRRQTLIFTLVFTFASIVLLIGSYSKLLPFTPTEDLAFITGALCVWLTVKENIWNWPIGIANNIFFFVLFLEQKLWGDMTLQIMFAILGFLGWYMWLFGGRGHTKLQISRTPGYVVVILTIIGLGATTGGTYYFKSIEDSAPLLDALITAMSLIAQFMLTKKYIENWMVWIVMDVISIGLYIHKGLYLTAALYAIFIGMCFAGLKEWRETLAKQEEPVFA